MKRQKIILITEILIFIILVVLDAIGYIPISQTIFIIPFIWLSLKLSGEKFSSIGFSFKDINIRKSIIIGVFLGLIMEIFAMYVTTPLISNFFKSEPDLTSLQDVQGNITMLLLYIVLSWILAAFGEEICFRGFLMNRISKLFGNTNSAWVISLVLSSILFGWGHTEQGITGWIQEGISGLILGIIFIKSNKNLTIPIITHGVSNTLAIILIYYGNYPSTF